MKPQSIGIVGGAGPLAGAFLLERILFLSGKNYGCYRDADYPEIFLLSFPFTDMLCPCADRATIQKELSNCLKQLRQNGAEVLGIACNTLHAFLDGSDDLSDLVHLPRTLAEKLILAEKPLVLCTSTSAKAQLHKQFLPCCYPDESTQSEIDEIIDQILKGCDSEIVIESLKRLIQAQSASTIILGCTELSLYSSSFLGLSKQVIDPLEMLAFKIVEKSFVGQ